MQRGEMTCLRAQSRQEADLGFKLGQLDSRAQALGHPLHCFPTTWAAETHALDPRHPAPPPEASIPLGCTCHPMTLLKGPCWSHRVVCVSSHGCVAAASPCHKSSLMTASVNGPLHAPRTFQGVMISMLPPHPQVMISETTSHSRQPRETEPSMP